MTQTIRERCIAYLVRRGYEKVQSRSTKYDKYQREHESHAYFLGKRGALKFSPTGKVKDAYKTIVTM